MSKVAVVYWSQTGNTQQMAEILADALGAEAIEATDFDTASAGDYDAFAFGCPASGAEELDSEFEAVWDASVPALGEKPVVLFGSHDWGSGEWMDAWKEAAEGAGVNVVDTVIATLEPDDEAAEALKAAAAKLA